MAFTVQFILATLLVMGLRAHPTDQGPQTFDQNTSPSPQLQPQGYVMKEVIAYLKPSQIRALEAGEAFIQPVYEQPSHNYQQIQNEYKDKDAKGREQTHLQQEYKIRNQEISNVDPQVKHIYPPQVEEPNNEDNNKQQPEFQLQIREKYNNRFEKNQQQHQSYAYVHFSSEGIPQNNQKWQLFFPEPYSNQNEQQHYEKNLEIQTDPLLNQKYQLIPYEYDVNKKQGNSKVEKLQVEQKLKEVVDQNQVQINAFLPSLPEQREKFVQKEVQNVNEIQLQYAPKYNDKKYKQDIENLVKKNQLEKQRAHKLVEAIAKSPPVVVHKEITVSKRRPAYIIKHVNVPISTPFLVPVLKPFQINVPQPYSVPLEVEKHISIPVEKKSMIE